MLALELALEQVRLVEMVPGVWSSAAVAWPSAVAAWWSGAAVWSSAVVAWRSAVAVVVWPALTAIVRLAVV